MRIADLVPGTCPEIVATIDSITEPFTTTSGRVGQTIVVSDDSGQLKVTLWGDKDITSPAGKNVAAQVGKYVVGDKIRLTNILIKTYMDALEATTGYTGKITKP